MREKQIKIIVLHSVHILVLWYFLVFFSINCA